MSSTPSQTPPTRKRKMSQEKFMLVLTALFTGGVLLFTIFPEDTPLRPVLMPLFLGLLTWAIYKWAI